MDVMKLSVSKEFIISTQPIGCITLLTVEAQHCHRDCQPCLPEVIPGKISELIFPKMDLAVSGRISALKRPIFFEKFFTKICDIDEER